MNKSPYTILFFGNVGSGKGTQAELLQKYLKDKDSSTHIVYAATGIEYRSIISSSSYTGKIIVENLSQGHLQPDFLTDALFVKILLNSDIKQESVIITDGYPRTIPQSKVFEEAMKFYKRESVYIIYIDVGKEEVIRRMKLRSRADDTDKAIKKRLDEYTNKVIPSMNYFQGKEGYTIYTINGEQSVEDVHKELIAKLKL